MKMPAESIEVRFPILAEDFSAYGNQIIDDLQALVASDQLQGASLVTPNYEGVRINFDTPSLKGWMLLRKSLHDPIMPLNIESDVEGGCEAIRKLLKPILATYAELDISKL